MFRLMPIRYLTQAFSLNSVPVELCCRADRAVHEAEGEGVGPAQDPSEILPDSGHTEHDDLRREIFCYYCEHKSNKPMFTKWTPVLPIS